MSPRESSRPVFARRCPGNKHCLQRGRAGGSIALGSAHATGGSPPAQESRAPLTLPHPARAGLEGGNWQLASSPGIVSGLNGRQLGFSGDWKSFPSAALMEGAGEGPPRGEGGLLIHIQIPAHCKCTISCAGRQRC